MPNFIDEYLVRLGASVDSQSFNRFNAVLDATAVRVSELTKSLSTTFVLAGSSVVGAITALTGASLGLFSGIARGDMDMQVLARRMFITTDAARKMKMATDALGYSMEDIIWGPPELQERYQQLVKDETAMLRLLGGDEGEKAFRTIRDVGFQFTRLEPALKIFGMRLVEDVINKFTGTPQSLEERLKHFVNWFESPEGFVKLSDYFSDKLVPFLRSVDDIVEKIFTKKNVDWVINAAGSGVDFLTKVMNWSEAHPQWAGAILGAMVGTSIGKAFGPWGAAGGALFGGMAGAGAMWKPESDSLQKAIKAHVESGMISKEFADALLAVGSQESGLNPQAPRGKAGEIGPFQIMPRTGAQYGFTEEQLMNPITNELAAEAILKDLYKTYGNWPEAFAHYNSSMRSQEAIVKGNRYSSDVMQRFEGYRVKPLAYGGEAGGGTTNNITVIAHSNASPDEIARVVAAKLDERDQWRRQVAMQNASRMYA